MYLPNNEISISQTDEAKSTDIHCLIIIVILVFIYYISARRVLKSNQIWNLH